MQLSFSAAVQLKLQAASDAAALEAAAKAAAIMLLLEQQLRIAALF